MYVNRVLRRAGLLAVRATPAGEMLDVFASRAFAVADHQVAHVYTHDRAATEAAADVLRSLDGVDVVLDGPRKRAVGLDHARAGDLVVVSKQGAWFAYPYWLDDRAAPDFARTVDIHRKPGYDPCELFIDPALRTNLWILRSDGRVVLGPSYDSRPFPAEVIAAINRGDTRPFVDETGEPTLSAAVRAAASGGRDSPGAAISTP